ncbi:MFS general substrate transporter [Metschnikowia bicuspidata var. bicuspidata NRRL YB-4993]|uniref:MFS general substrate transporter n=1 Tax=Metschnikowia bicuspidata var. bicuspidata NRRL YB-4993 TaxID=869754 RepID=A0A1A0HBG1_9ASCO|nr:MFS general substrate transporter [Metschnikowia bicuspidata var. bicuspidata NRRL YB-4993]OBA21474.1 MFS general substrate transporter [Metschnikowia bicuspidata var. bicuspidata NRRL YB-4993]
MSNSTDPNTISKERLAHNSQDNDETSNKESNANYLSFSTSPVEQKHPPEHLEDQLGNAHVNLLSMKKLLICLLGTSLSLFAAFCDQTSVTVALTYIAKDLDAQNTINWAGTASLLASTVFQVFFGRFADIFGRKEVLLACLCLLLISSLLCGFAANGPQFYIFRAIAGIGSGGVSSLSMVIMSDVVTLKRRGKLQGILGSSVGIGNAVGPLIMAYFAEQRTWRDFYRIMPPIILVIIFLVYFSVSSKKKSLDSVLSTREKLKSIDYIGSFFAAASLILLLIPVSGGGSAYPWNSALVIVMFIVGGICFAIFLLVEYKIPELPMIPLTIFKNFTLSVILFSTFLFGMAYYSFLFAVSYYFQLVRGHSVKKLAIFTLPLVLMQASMSAFAGSIMTFTGRYLPVMIAGYSFWFSGHAMTLLWDEHTSDAIIVGTMVVLGTGCGFIFQPTMVAAQANTRKAQRAVVISTRNVIRSFGGALGTAISSLIITNSLLKDIKAQAGSSILPPLYMRYMKANIYSHPDVSVLTKEQVNVVRHMYSVALRNYFYFTLPLLGICLLLAFTTRDHGLQCLDEPRDINGGDNDCAEASKENA